MVYRKFIHHNSSVEKSANVFSRLITSSKAKVGARKVAQQVLVAKPGEQLGRGIIYSCSAIYMCKKSKKKSSDLQ